MREPLKPIKPADDQETALPCVSVMVMMVLLKVAATWATPTTTFFFSFLRARAGGLCHRSLPLFRDFFLAGDRFGRPFARAGVGVRALAADRQALAVTQAAIAAQIHQPLDVHRHFAAQIAFDEIVAVDRFADLDDLGVGQIVTRRSRRCRPCSQISLALAAPMPWM